MVWVGEFGRTPRINKANSGREHWPHCYSAVLAGAGVRGGLSMALPIVGPPIRPATR